MSGVIAIEGVRSLREDLYPRLFEVSRKALVLDMKNTEIEEGKFYSFLDAYWKSQGMDWVLGNIRVRQFVREYKSSGCSHLLNDGLRHDQSAFLNPINLKEHSKYNENLVKYLCHPMHFQSFGSVERAPASPSQGCT